MLHETGVPVCEATVKVRFVEVAGGTGGVARVRSDNRMCIKVPTVEFAGVTPGWGTMTFELGICVPFTNTLVVERKFCPVK